MKTPAELRQQAEHYRRLQAQISDRITLQAVCELIDEIDMEAAMLEKRCLIRQRAHEIWVERWCPVGRDVEHWLLAERELAENEQPARRTLQ